MKNVLKHSLLIASTLLLSLSGFSQFGQLKKFDFSVLEGKTLYIPTYEVSAKFAKRMARKGKVQEINDAKAEAEKYNKAWKEAMAESSYSATDYEIRAFNQRDLNRSKDPKAMIMYYYVDDNGNTSACLAVTGPKKVTVARSVINGFDLSDKNDIRLMMNMLNESMITATEVQDGGQKVGYKNLRNKYKQRVVEFIDGIGDKTFLVSKSEHKKPKKASERNSDLRLALKSWSLSKYELKTEAEINEKRLEGDEDSYYWRDIPYYTNNILITYHINYIISTANDEVLFAFMGKKRLKPATLKEIENKLKSKSAKYKKQLQEG